MSALTGFFGRSPQALSDRCTRLAQVNIDWVTFSNSLCGCQYLDSP